MNKVYLQTERYEYDKKGLRVKKITEYSFAKPIVTEYKYDENDKLKFKTDINDAFHVEYEYNKGILIKETEYSSAYKNYIGTQRIYNNNGNLLKITLCGEEIKFEIFEVGDDRFAKVIEDNNMRYYKIDDNDRITTIYHKFDEYDIINSVPGDTFGYDELGDRYSKMMAFNGIRTKIIREPEYDENNRLKSVVISYDFDDFTHTTGIE